MALVCTGSVSVNWQVTETLSLGFASSSVQSQDQPAYSFANGTGSAQIDEHWESSAVTLAASASQTYTLSSLTDDAGRTIPFAKIRGLIIRCTSRTAGDYLTVGAAGTHPLTSLFGSGTDVMKVFDLLLLAVGQTDGYAVTSGSADQLKILNSGSNSITFKIGVIGTHT